MSQSGYTTLQSYYSNTAGHIPTSANLSSGELAVNIADGKLFYKDSNGNVQVLATGNSANGVFTNVTITGTATVNTANVTTLNTANAQITGGSISNVSISFDSINNTPIGNSAPSTGAFTTIKATQSIVVGANSTPISVLISTTDAIGIPSGNTVQQPANAAAGYLRFNTDLGQFQGYNGTIWGQIGGGASANGVVYENSQTLNQNYTMTTGNSGESVGPITVTPGVTVTIPAGSRWVIL